jgi:hypothetical protein
MIKVEIIVKFQNTGISNIFRVQAKKKDQISETSNVVMMSKKIMVVK